MGTITVIHVGDVISNLTAVNRYTITRTYRATDACGNTAVCTQTITVNDQTAPQVTCPADITVIESPAGSGTAIVNFSVTATDGCDGAITPVNVPASGSAFPVGETLVTSTATDASGNSVNCSFKVTVQPACQITCPANKTVNTLPTDIQCGTIVTYPAATTTGNCGTLTYSKPSGSFFDVGETIVTVSSPSTGQSCTFKVTVVDKTKPTIICLAPVAVKCASLVPATIFTGVAFDNCSIVNGDEEEPLAVINVQFVSDVISNQTYPNKYTITRTFMATDLSGNTSTCAQTITVNDDVVPVLSATPANIIIKCAANVPVPAVLTATDNCGTASVTHTDVLTPGSCDNKFSITRTWTATDLCGNTATTSQIITVNDDVVPVLSAAPANIIIKCAANVPIPAVLTATDNCGTASITRADVLTPGSCDNKFSITRTWTATDLCGNTATKSQTIIVNDDVPPVPPVFAQVLLEYDCITDVPTAPTVNATDNCDGNVPGVLVVTDNGGTGCGSSPLIITRTWTFTDGCGNSSTAVQTVKVLDDEAPTISGVTLSQTSLWPPNHKMRDVYVGYTAADNCNVTTTLSVRSNEPIQGTGDGDASPDWIIGTDGHSLQLRAEKDANGNARFYTITITATDACGNSSSKEVTVVVAHNITAPVSGNSFRVGSTVNFSGVFWDKPGNRHTGKWLIDGTTSVNATITEPSGNQNGKSTGSYKFNTPGVYKLQMNITDQAGVTSYANTNGDLEAIVVIYDPNGGYTYGGGWYQSQAGAVVSNPAATGKASYGFTVNYYKNATNPKGESQFEFKVGTFEFNALNFDYLSIQGARAQFRGTGKITGGQSGVAFIMTVIDGELDGSGVDKVRMKIYNKTTNVVYYDNQPGASDASNPVTSVGSNSLVFIGGAAGNNLITKTQREVIPEQLAVEELEISVLPNPTSSSYTILVNSANKKDRIMLQVVDVSGRLVEVRNNINAGSAFRLGDLYRPGSYFIRVVQGKKHKEMKLIKIPD